jgi:hypothetical protein
MSLGFVLRFQEATVAGTDERTAKTRTFVEKEKPDEGRVLPVAGTKTITEVKRETPDNDLGSRNFNVLPQ